MQTTNPLPVSLAIIAMSMLCLPSPSLAQGQSTDQSEVDLTRPLTLATAIRVALQKQPTLGIAAAQLRSARARTVESRASYFPQITPSVTYQHSKTTFGATGGGTQSATAEETTSAIALRQLVYDTGKREANVAAAQANARASEYGLQDTRQQIVVSVSSAWYELLRRQELVKVQVANVQRAKTTLDATTAFAQAGTSPQKDVLQAQADYDNALVQLSIARNDVRLGQTSLKNAMGLMMPTALVLPTDPLPAPSAQKDTRTAAQYLDTALAQRPDLKRDIAGVDAQRQSLKVARIESGLQVEADLTASYRFDPDRGDNRSFVTVFSYPLFDAGLTRSRVEQARNSMTQQQLQVELTRQSLQLEVEQAYLLREEARERIASTQTAVAASRQNYDAAREAQTEGAGTIIDVITAQAQLVTAETNAIQAVYDYYAADARLQRAIGSNDPDAAGGSKP